MAPEDKNSSPRTSFVLNNGSQRKVAIWYALILGLSVTSLYAALGQTSLYKMSSFSSYLHDGYSAFPTTLPTARIRDQESAKEKDTEYESRPALAYSNIVPILIPDKDNPVHVVVVPEGETTSESIHIFNDGIEQSPYLIREHNSSNFHLPDNFGASDYSQTNLVWVAKGYAKFPRQKSEKWCDAFEEVVKKAMEERRELGLPGCCWQIFIVDYSDEAKVQGKCKAVEELMGREFVHYFKRSIVEGRDWNATTQWIENGSVVKNAIFVRPENQTVLGKKKRQVRHVSYPVRTDLLRSVETELQLRNSSEDNPVTLVDPIESILEREYDFTHLWNLDPNNTRKFGMPHYPKFRWRISSILKQFVHENNYTAFIGVAGRKDERGRRGVHRAYIDKLLKSKIVVVTQQDRWEDHYRLMEAMVSGAMIMTDKMLSLPEGYEPGVSIVEFSSPEDLKEKLAYFADRKNSHERQKIAAAGRRVALEQHRSWHVMEKIIFGGPQSNCATVSNQDCPYILDVDPTKIDEPMPRSMDRLSLTEQPEIKVIKATPRNKDGFLLGNRKLCRALSEENSTQIHFKENDCGSLGSISFGNYLSRWYLTRLLAGVGGAILSGSCSGNRAMQWIPTLNIRPEETIIDGDFSQETFCKSCFEPTQLEGNPCIYPHEGKRIRSGLYHIIPTIQKDMTSLLNGVLSEKPFELDEVAIHVRLGDIMLSSNDLYGLLPFQSYVKYIPPDSKSIGIVTAPFDQQRTGSNNNPTLNEAVVSSLQEYLTKRFPNANVTVRNSKEDTVDVVYGRLLGAKTLFCGPSTFCLIPALGRTSNTIVVQAPLFGGSPNWLDDVAKRYDNFQYAKEPVIGSNVLYNVTAQGIIYGLRNMEGEESNHGIPTT
ncbi:MAG: hypothetical protein SGILL_003425 [Bacillariaceae sp.]